MTAEEKRDATVYLAEHVMGWKIPDYTTPSVGIYYMTDKHVAVRFEPTRGVLVAWNPWESIADAWMLVEALSRRGLCVELTMDPPPFSRAHCVLSAQADATSCPGYFSNAATMSEAICLAALEVAKQEPK